MSLWTWLVPKKCLVTCTFAKSLEFLEQWPRVFGEMLSCLYRLKITTEFFQVCTNLTDLAQSGSNCPGGQNDSSFTSAFNYLLLQKNVLWGPRRMLRKNAMAFQHFLFTQASNNYNQSTLKLLTFISAHLIKLCLQLNETYEKTKQYKKLLHCTLISLLVL